MQETEFVIYEEAGSMERKIYDKLLKWKETSMGESALLIQGARRVGKSYIVEEFVRQEYDSYILVDFNLAGQEVKDIFLNDINDLDTFFIKLSTLYNVKLHERRSAIVLDEVQLFPRARSVIKYLVADGRYDYYETGSLISIKKNTADILIPSEEDHMDLNPMDFEEFLWAMGDTTMADMIKTCYTSRKPMGAALHRKAMNLFRQYIIIGGMPQAVKEYSESRDLEKADRIKRRILQLYRDDIRKHADEYLKVEAIFDEIPSQLKNTHSHFKLSSLKNGARYDEFSEPLFWLSDAMIVNNCFNVTEPNYGLRLNQDRRIFKCYMGDTGLLVSHSFDENEIIDEEVYKKLLLGKLEVNMGMVMENIVAQMLRASGHKLYFYTNSDRLDKDNRMEIDFVFAKSKITNRHNISPIEVKSGKNYTLSSIRKFMSKFSQQLAQAYVLHTGDLEEREGILFLPLYMTMML